MNKNFNRKNPKIGFVKRTKVPLHQKVDELLSKGILPSITFHHADNTKQVQTLSTSFLTNEKGNFRSGKDIAHDLHAIKHDLKAIGLEL